MLDLARDVMQLPCTSSLHGRHHPAGIYSLLPDSDNTCSHDVTRALKKKKKTSQSEGFSTRAHVLCSSVTCAVHSANRTHRAGHVEFHTRVRVKNPSRPNPSTQPGLCPSAGSATSTACVSGPGLTLAAMHAGVSSVAQHGTPARCRADPGRSQMKLPPLPGFCPSTVAVSISILPTHNCQKVLSKALQNLFRQMRTRRFLSEKQKLTY